MKHPIRRSLALVALMMATVASAQRPSQETVVGLAQSPSVEARAALDANLYDYQVFELDVASADRHARANGTLNLHLGNRTYEIDLALNDLRGENFQAVIVGRDGDMPVSTTVGTWAGTLMDDVDSVVRLAMFDDFFEGYIRTKSEWLFIDPLSNYVDGAGPRDVVVYRDIDARPDATKGCGVSRLHNISVDVGLPSAEAPLTRMPRRVDIATEADGQYFQQFGNPGIFNRMSAAINGVDGIYRPQLNLTLNLVYQQGWPNASSDPYTSLNAQTTLTQFRSWWQANRTNINRDVAHQFSGKNFSGSTIGIAWVGVICNRPDLSYGVSEDQSSSFLRTQLAAHEIGHNFSAQHDNQIGCAGVSCGTTGPIMCSFIQSNGSNQFSNCSRNSIANHTANNGFCLN